MAVKIESATDFCERLDKEIGEYWSNDPIELPMRIQEYAENYHKAKLKEKPDYKESLDEADKLMLVNVCTQWHLFQARADAIGTKFSKIHWKLFSYLLAIDFLYKAGMEPYMYAIADVLGTTAQTAKSNIDKLAEQGLVEREDYKLPKLTAYGQSIADKYFRIQIEHVNKAWLATKENFEKQLNK